MSKQNDADYDDDFPENRVISRPLSFWSALYCILLPEVHSLGWTARLECALAE